MRDHKYEFDMESTLKDKYAEELRLNKKKVDREDKYDYLFWVAVVIFIFCASSYTLFF